MLQVRSILMVDRYLISSCTRIVVHSASVAVTEVESDVTFQVACVDTVDSDNVF